jgi:SAGA-associated factor 29
MFRVNHAEVECWSHAAESLHTLSKRFQKTTEQNGLGPVNRLISSWPADDTVPAEGLGGVETIYTKLSTGLHALKTTCNDDVKYVLNISHVQGFLSDYY